MVLHASIGMALMAEAARHPSTVSLSLSLSLFLPWDPPTSPPSLSGNDLGQEGCEVDFGVNPLGESCGPLRMVLVDDTSIEFEEAGVRPIEVAVGEKDKEKGT